MPQEEEEEHKVEVVEHKVEAVEAPNATRPPAALHKGQRGQKSKT